MIVRCAMSVLLLSGTPILAQTAPSSASESAKKFNLDPSVLQGDDTAGQSPDEATGNDAASRAIDPGDPAFEIALEPPVNPAAATAEEVRPAPVTPKRIAAPSTGVLTLDTPIAALIADPRGKRVLDRDLPGLSSDENLSKFSGKSLREFQPLTGGQLTDALLDKVAADLATSGKPPARRATER